MLKPFVSITLACPALHNLHINLLSRDKLMPKRYRCDVNSTIFTSFRCLAVISHWAGSPPRDSSWSFPREKLFKATISLRRQFAHFNVVFMSFRRRVHVVSHWVPRLSAAFRITKSLWRKVLAISKRCEARLVLREPTRTASQTQIQVWIL